MGKRICETRSDVLLPASLNMADYPLAANGRTSLPDLLPHLMIIIGTRISVIEQDAYVTAFFNDCIPNTLSYGH